MKKSINPQHKYHFPSKIEMVEHKGKTLVVLPETSNWIVLDNSIQTSFFKELLEKKISDALLKFSNNKQECIYVLTQIEARHLESTAVSRNTRYAMHLYLTNECNMRCPHCYMSAGAKDNLELSTEEVCKLFRDFYDHNGIGVVLSGGEVALRSDLTEIIEYGDSLGLQMEILSNGTLLSPSTIHSIAPHLHRAQISIDGFSEESNARVRGSGNFQKALTALNNLIYEGINTELAITPFPYKDLALQEDAYVNFGLNLLSMYGDRLNIKITTDIFEGRNIKPSLEEKASYAKITEHISNRINGDTGRLGGFILAARHQAINDNYSFGNINIASNGDVYPCAKIKMTSSFANVRTHTIEEILLKSRSLQEKSNVNNLIPCKDCELKFICGGGCRLDYFKEC